MVIRIVTSGRWTRLTHPGHSWTMAVSPPSSLFQSPIAKAQERVGAAAQGTPEWREAQQAAIEVRRAFWDEMRRTWRPAYADQERRGRSG
jgi:hypothetical protein